MRTALEERLNRASRTNNQDILRLRRQVAFDRFLARIFASRESGQFVLKGGYAMELRLHSARTTKDIDISIDVRNGTIANDQGSMLRMIQRAAADDLGDFFEYAIGESILDLETAVYGGYRFPVECRMAGRRFAHFNIDIAAGDMWIESHELLSGKEWLEFAGISAPRIPAISTEQQFAEKIHSYSLPRQTENSRAKDLVDMVLLIGKCNLDPVRLRDAIVKTFNRRKTHEVPDELQDPPETWVERYKKMALECGLSGDMYSAINTIREFYKTVIAQK